MENKREKNHQLENEFGLEKYNRKLCLKERRKIIEMNTRARKNVIYNKTTNYTNKSSSLSDKLPG